MNLDGRGWRPRDAVGVNDKMAGGIEGSAHVSGFIVGAAPFEGSSHSRRQSKTAQNLPRGVSHLISG